MDTQKMENTGNDTNRIEPATPVAVIILNWNGAKLLREYLPQVIATIDSAISTLIVADNGSTDDSLALLESDFAGKVQVIAFPENYGFAEGYNRAIAMCAGYEYAVLLNSDVATTAGWDVALYNYMCSHADVGACQPKILAYRDRQKFEYAGAAGGYLDRDGYPYCRGRIFDTCEVDSGQYDTVVDVHWASGACLMVRTALYLACGGLDKDFFAHMEEIDLCWRMRLAGYRLACVPSATVLHLGGGSLSALNPFKTYLNFRNNLLMLHKNLPADVRGRKLVRRRLLDTLAWAKYVATFQWKHAAAVVRAHRHFAKMRKNYSTDATTNLLGGDRYSSRSILWQYFVRRRRTFVDIFSSKDD